MQTKLPPARVIQEQLEEAGLTPNRVTRHRDGTYSAQWWDYENGGVESPAILAQDVLYALEGEASITIRHENIADWRPNQPRIAALVAFRLVNAKAAALATAS